MTNREMKSDSSVSAGASSQTQFPVLVTGACSWTGAAIIRALQAADRPSLAVVDGENSGIGGVGVELWQRSLGPIPQARVAIIGSINPGDLKNPCDTRLKEFEADLALCAIAGIKRLVVLSGLEAIGPRSSAQQQFEGEGEHPIGEIGVYLRDMEKAAFEYRDQYGIELVVLRAGHLYGDGEMGVLEDLLSAMNGDENNRELLDSGKDVRFQPIHVRDLARAAVVATEKGDWIYHLGTNGCPTISELVQKLRRTAQRKGVQIGHVEPDISHHASSDLVHYPWPCHRAERELDYVADWTLEGGFADLLDSERTQELMTELGVERKSDLSLSPEEQQGDLMDREGRFWDEQEAAEALLYDQPHDWAFDPQLGNIIQAPVYRFMRSVFGSSRPQRVLDLGCGGGVYSRWMASGGVKTVGIDLSAAKIAKAKRLAEQDGIAHLCDFRVANAMDFALEEPVDVICAFGVLHHFPDLEKHLPGILERNLKPGGILIAIEPHCEDGFHPFFQSLMKFFGSTWLRRFFDGERYARINEEARLGVSLRGESPAGLEVHDHDHVEIDELLLRDYDPQLVRFHHMLSPFVANAFVIYQRSRLVRGLVRLTMPLTVRLDGFLCRFKRFQDWAALGMYAVTRKDS